MTAFLTILFVLMAAFICSIAEIAAVHEEKCYRRTDVDKAVYSVFAEYQKDLLETYHVFGVDAGYESGTYTEDAVIGRLAYYGADGMEHEITDIQFLTDNGGAAFYEQVLYYMETVYGIGLVQEFAGLTEEWEEQMVRGEEYYREKEAAASGTDGWEPEGSPGSEEQPAPKDEEAVQEAENMLLALQQKETAGFLGKVLPEGFQVSSAAAAEEEFPSARRLNRGYGSFRQEDLSGPLKKLLFGEYLLENFSTALAPKKTQGGLAYEIEYILGGKSSDRENLDAVAKRLTLMRFAADYICLQTDGARKAEARAAAGLICAALLIPGAAEALAQLILLVWAYREAMSDVKTLLAGGSVPLVKTKDSWQLPLDMVTGTGSSGEMPALPQAGVSGPPQAQDGKTRPGGMDYKDYLRILLFLEKRETETMRSLDMIESGLKIGKGKSFFRADLCMAKLKLRSTAVLAAGVSYDFPTGFAYR